MGAMDQMVGEGIATEVWERARMMNMETTMIYINDNSNEYLRNNTQAKLRRKFHQQQWDTASRPILGGGQGKKVFDNMQQYRRQRRAVRKVKDVSVTWDGFVCEWSSNWYAGV